MNFDVSLARPDGTPTTDNEVPAPGTLLVVEVTESVLAVKPWLKMKVLGWAPDADPMARTLLGGACKALNQRADVPLDGS